MEEDLAQLTESTFFTEYMVVWLRLNFPLYDQIKLRPVSNSATYKEYDRECYYNLAVRYSRLYLCFDLSQVNDSVFKRFIELLASLTLYYFSKTSKSIFYTCLDLRGLEYKSLVLKFEQNYKTSISRDEGMRVGCINQINWAPYLVCYGSIDISMKTFYDVPKIPFVKKYKNLYIIFLDIYFDDLLIDFCDAIFHPGVEHVHATIDFFDTNYEEISLQKAFMFLDYCRNVKYLEYYFSDCGSMYPTFAGDPPFLPIKARLEQWAATQTTRLEIFLFSYKNVAFQWHEKRLKRLVKLEDKWYWSDNCDLDNNQFQNYHHYDRNFYDKLSTSQMQSLMDNVVEYLSL